MENYPYQVRILVSRRGPGDSGMLLECFFLRSKASKGGMKVGRINLDSRWENFDFLPLCFGFILEHLNFWGRGY